MTTQAITVLVCALGGEGGGVLSEWLYETAVHCGHSAQSSSIPGVAQRTGATTYYVEVYPLPDAKLGGRQPVFSLNPVPGAIDLLVSSELLETVRQIGLGMASADRTQVVSSSSRALTVAEKMQLGDGRADDSHLLAVLQQHARKCEVFDMWALAQMEGTVVSAVLFGAVAASGRLPFPRAAFEDTIRRGGKGVDASLRGFAAAFDALAVCRAQHLQAQAQAPQAAVALAPAAAAAPALPEPLRSQFPTELHDLLALGHARLIDYQDTAYATLYAQRLAEVLTAERAADPDGSNAWATTRETARWLALWMAYDDIVRVAALKLRRSRFERVRREVAALDDEIVKVYDYFKPGAAEFASLLPTALARRLSGWDARRIARGQDAWALPMKLGTHTVLGSLALRLVAGLKGLRRAGSRFALEQSLIEHWLAAVNRATREQWKLGHEVAMCGRLIKGYGSTNERGKANLSHVVEHLAGPGGDATTRGDLVRAARIAALADDAGIALDRTLAAHGAPVRPLREQPIRWHRRPPGDAAAPRP